MDYHIHCEIYVLFITNLCCVYCFNRMRKRTSTEHVSVQPLFLYFQVGKSLPENKRIVVRDSKLGDTPTRF